MRYEHYQRVVQWDLLQRFPNRKQETEIPKLEKVTRVWSLIGLGFQPQSIPAAWTALEFITGQPPKLLYTKKSVAQRRLKEGDPVGCMVQVTGKHAYDRREQWIVRIFPEIRPFHGFHVKRSGSSQRSQMKDSQTLMTKGSKRSGVMDQHGQLTFHMEQPGVIPARSSYYESYFQLVSGSSGNRVGGRYRSVHTTAKTKEEGLALIEGRRFPLR